MEEKKVLIIGTGIGGLSVAGLLANNGYSVEMHDKQDQVGGKAAKLEVDGFRFDKGPSLMTMPHVMKDFFSEVGESIDHHLELMPLESICRYFWSDGTLIEEPADHAAFDEALQEQLHEPEGSFKKYMEYTTDIYSIAAPVFLYKEIKIFSWKAVKMLFQFRKLDAFRTMHESNEAHFTNPKTVQLFDRYATYTGSSPYKAPATLNIIPHVEHAYGGWLPKKGIHAIPEAMARVAREKDVDIHLNSSVDSIVKEGKKVTGVKIGGEKHQCDIIVANSDVKATYHSLLGDRDSKMAKRYEQLEPSSSGLVFYWGMDCTFPEFSINNILFSDNYQEEFHELFESMHVPSEPTVYINITSKLIPRDAPRGCENWFVLVNAPCNVGQDWDAEIKKARNSVLEKIKETIGEDVSGHVMHEHLLSPVDIQRLTGSSQGSLYGISSNSRTAAFKRQSNNSKQYKNLYFAGGSAHPGGGIPMVTLSGKICSRLIMEDHS